MASNTQGTQEPTEPQGVSSPSPEGHLPDRQHILIMYYELGVLWAWCSKEPPLGAVGLSVPLALTLDETNYTKS